LGQVTRHGDNSIEVFEKFAGISCFYARWPAGKPFQCLANLFCGLRLLQNAAQHLAQVSHLKMLLLGAAYRGCRLFSGENAIDFGIVDCFTHIDHGVGERHKSSFGGAMEDSYFVVIQQRSRGVGLIDSAMTKHPAAAQFRGAQRPHACRADHRYSL
jgi:hypothetical protein